MLCISLDHIDVLNLWFTWSAIHDFSQCHILEVAHKLELLLGVVALDILEERFHFCFVFEFSFVLLRPVDDPVVVDLHQLLLM